jgi:hypothetical protein
MASHDARRPLRAPQTVCVPPLVASDPRELEEHVRDIRVVLPVIAFEESQAAETRAPSAREVALLSKENGTLMKRGGEVGRIARHVDKVPPADREDSPACASEVSVVALSELDAVVIDEGRVTSADLRLDLHAVVIRNQVACADLRLDLHGVLAFVVGVLSEG